jgi:hypothetical protein
MNDRIFALWIVAIIVSAVVLGTVVVAVAMHNGIWFGGMMGRYHDGIHDGDDFRNGTWQNQNDTDNGWCRGTNS